MITQIEFILRPKTKGFHLITNDILKELSVLPEIGILNLFIKHTSAALAINENYDPDVRTDLNSIFNKLVPECEPYYTHTSEGKDDMPAHGKSTIIGNSLTIPIKNNKINLGIWQGIYLCEFRNNGGPRDIVATIIG